MRNLISRYPTVPKLKGKLGGQIANMSKPNGMIKTLIAASAIAFANKGISYFWVGPEVWLVCTRAEDIKELIDVGFEKDRVSRRFSFDFFVELFGPGLITDPKPEWKERRAAAYRPMMLSKTRLADYMPVNRLVIQTYLNRACEKQTVKLHLLLEEFVLANLMATFYSLENMDDCTEIVNRSLPFLQKYIAEVFRFRNIAKFRTPAFLRKIIYRGEETDFAKIRRSMQDELLRDLGDKRSLIYNHPDNFITHLRTYMTEKNGVAATDEDLTGEVITTFFAGWDSTATTLHWVIRALEAFHPVKEKLLVELSKQTALDNEYLNAVIYEAMRLYPPFPMITRGIDKSFTYDGLHLKKKSVVIFPLLALHRDRKIWGGDADQFRPERFLELTPEQKKSYKPFGTGQQSCVAMHFAMQIMKLFISELYTKYSVSLSHTRCAVNCDFMSLDTVTTLDLGGTTKPLDYTEAQLHFLVSPSSQPISVTL